MKVANSLLECALINIDSEQNKVAAQQIRRLIEYVADGGDEPDWPIYGMLITGYLKSLLEMK